MSSTISSSLSGMAQAQNQMLTSANRIANWGSGQTISNPPQQLESEIFNIIQSKHTFSANAAVFKTEDEMLGTLLDILA